MEFKQTLRQLKEEAVEFRILVQLLARNFLGKLILNAAGYSIPIPLAATTFSFAFTDKSNDMNESE